MSIIRRELVSPARHKLVEFAAPRAWLLRRRFRAARDAYYDAYYTDTEAVGRDTK